MADARRYIIIGKIMPYVRMTQNGKWVNERARGYMSSQKAIGWQFKSQTNQMMPEQTPLSVNIKLEIPERMHTADIDNIGKALIDAAQGIVFKNDCWIDEIYIRRVAGDTHCCVFVIEVI